MKPKKINIFDLKRKAKPFKSIINLYTMYKVNITKKGEKNENNTRGNSYK